MEDNNTKTEDSTTGGFTAQFKFYNTCPSCGRCKECGQPEPIYPYQPVYPQPFRPIFSHPLGWPYSTGPISGGGTWI